MSTASLKQFELPTGSLLCFLCITDHMRLAFWLIAGLHTGNFGKLLYIVNNTTFRLKKRKQFIDHGGTDS